MLCLYGRTIGVPFTLDGQNIVIPAVVQVDASGNVVAGAGGSSGGLTNTELRASAVPVSLTSLPALATGGNVIGAVAQSGSWTVTIGNASIAVTAAALPLPAGAATSARQPAIGTAGSPASDILTVQGAAAMTPFKVDGSGVTQPVSGTVSVSGTVPVSIATTVATRDAKDAGRTQFSAATAITGVTAVAAEAMLSMVPVRAGVASAAATSIKATAGKILRLTAIVFSVKSTSAAVLAGVSALRMNPNGAAVATSPIVAILSATQQAAALAQAGDTCVLPLPDGIEISGNQEVGLSQLCSASTGVVYASVIGFEY